MLRNRRFLRLASAAAAFAAIAFSAATPHVFAEEQEVPSLKELADLEELKALFKADEDSPRLLILLSPT